MTDSNAKPRRGRPPKVDRDFSDTRAALIRCGMEILTEQGFTATGIDAVLKRVGVPKGSFYHYFESKEAFGQAVLDSYATYFAHKLDRWLLQDDVSPLQRLSQFAEDSKVGMARYDFCRGCLVGNLGQEVAVLPDGFRLQLEAIFRSWEARLARCLKAAQETGELAAHADCEALAQFFWIGWEGAVLRSRLTRNTDPLDIFFTGFLAGLPR